jgi:hypothetical protein
MDADVIINIQDENITTLEGRQAYIHADHRLQQ